MTSIPSLTAVWNVEVWHQVLKDFEGQPMLESIAFTTAPMAPIVPTGTTGTPATVEFLEKDCVYAAIDQVRIGLKPLLLNMASEFKPGGGVGKGSTAQEEDLFRRSDYFRHLHPKHYPLRDTTCIISKDVLFYRLAAADKYALMQYPAKIDCVAAAAIRKPVTTHAGTRFAYASDRELMLSKIRAVFAAAASNGNDCLVLSAWGCGAFRGPIHDVAQLFRQVVEEYQYTTTIKRVVFAIHDNTTFREFKGAFEV